MAATWYLGGVGSAAAFCGTVALTQVRTPVDGACGTTLRGAAVASWCAVALA